MLGDDGAVTWRLVRGVVTRDDKGVPVRFSGTNVDITRIKDGKLDVSDAENPSLVGRLETGGNTAILSAVSPERVVLLVTAAPSYSGATLPEAALPWSERSVVEVDVSVPDAPEVVSTFTIPAQTQLVLEAGEPNFT